MSFDPNSERLAEVPTPALVVDADALERNLAKMDDFLARADQRARPHTKTHKSVEIARLQMQQKSTVGLCCARLSEAETLAGHGVAPLLVTSPSVSRDKISRLIDLASRCDVWTVVDSETGWRALEAAARAKDQRCGVIVDLDPGFHRTGVVMGDAALQLARSVAASDSLVFHGVQMYAGTLMHLQAADERRSSSNELWEQVGDIVRLLRAEGVECPVVTGGGTGTFDIDSTSDLVTDLQVGSYVFMDGQYRGIENEASCGDDAPFDFFEPSLYVLATAISQAVPEMITVDAGTKALSTDQPPVVVGARDCRYHFAGDEHGMIDLRQRPGAITLGDRVALLVGHCDPTVNLHDHYVVLRDGRPETTWKVIGRGVA